MASGDELTSDSLEELKRDIPDMASADELTSDSLDELERDIPDFLLKDLKSRVLHFLSESKDFSAKIRKTASGQYKLIFSLGSRHAQRQMNMGTSPDANAILVKNIPSTVDEDLLEVFFESRKKNGGGPVKSVKLFWDKQFALVEFEEPESVQIVMKKTPIEYGNTTLDVQPYSPLLECDGNITSLDVNGLPKQLTDDILDMHLNSIAQPEYTAKKVFGFFPSSSTTLRQEHNSQKDIASIKKKIPSVSHSDDPDNCIQASGSALEEWYTCYTHDDYIDLIQSLTKAEMDKLKKTECCVDMKIDQTAGIIRIQGLKKIVLDAQTELHKCLKDFERQRQRQGEAETLYQQIQWQYEEVQIDGIKLVPYDKMTNLKIETAYKNKKASIELMDATDGTVYVVDFMSLEEYIKGDKDNSATVVVRKDILKDTKQPFPIEWTAMKEDENIRITNLLTSDPTYQQIEKRFVTEVTSGQYNSSISSMKNVKVTKIVRIQNKALYQQYVAKKELMTKQTPNPPAQYPIERTVWHGTSYTTVSSIQMYGFNRSYAGDKNGDPWYGHGVYFAADASYSARSWLSGANASGDRTTKGYIFLVKALTGEFCKGTKGMRFLPPKNPSNKTVLYDCAVDNVANPMEFAIFHDAQAYPEYLITFVS